MSVVINDVDIGKKQVNFGEFMYLVLNKYDQIEDNLFVEILKDSDSNDVVGKDFFDSYLSNKTFKIPKISFQ
ncbi:MAG: hypothetical protein WC850_03090 [Candidatus Gracilibacteria bacterium]